MANQVNRSLLFCLLILIQETGFHNVNQLAEKAQTVDSRTSYLTNRDQYLRMIDGLIYGEDPRQGYVADNTFFHPELKFQFPVPQSWQTNNTPSQVQMAPKDGKALMILSITEAASLQEAAQQIQENYQLKVVESSQIKVNGFPTYAMVSDQTNEQSGQTIRIMTYLIDYNDLIYTFHGLSTLSDFDNYTSFFQQTMKQLQPIDRSFTNQCESEED